MKKIPFIAHGGGRLGQVPLGGMTAAQESFVEPKPAEKDAAFLLL